MLSVLQDKGANELPAAAPPVDSLQTELSSGQEGTTGTTPPDFQIGRKTTQRPNLIDEDYKSRGEEYQL